MNNFFNNVEGLEAVLDGLVVSSNLDSTKIARAVSSGQDDIWHNKRASTNMLF
jgi:hypothetical protein